MFMVLLAIQLPAICECAPLTLFQAAVEQVAFWFTNRSALGEIRYWPAGGNYVQLADTDLLPGVRAVLGRYRRVVI
jgi:hypothetical protein